VLLPRGDVFSIVYGGGVVSGTGVDDLTLGLAYVKREVLADRLAMDHAGEFQKLVIEFKYTTYYPLPYYPPTTHK
jgi:hypothetical protein